MVSKLRTPILNCCTYLLWAYVLTDSEFSCLAMLAKPYTVSGPTYIPRFLTYSIACQNVHMRCQTYVSFCEDFASFLPILCTVVTFQEAQSVKNNHILLLHSNDSGVINGSGEISRIPTFLATFGTFP